MTTIPAAALTAVPLAIPTALLLRCSAAEERNPTAIALGPAAQVLPATLAKALAKGTSL